MEKRKKIQSTSPRCSWTFSLLYHVTELTCLEKPETIEGNENFKFAYADMHGNLKFVSNKPLKRKYVKHFRSEKDIHIISAYYEEDEF